MTEHAARPSHVYHSYFVENLRTSLGVEVFTIQSPLNRLVRMRIKTTPILLLRIIENFEIWRFVTVLKVS